jgi:hypothetical protein
MELACFQRLMIKSQQMEDVANGIGMIKYVWNVHKDGVSIQKEFVHL